MKKIYLCGHTGSANRGCEAIVRSTVNILRGVGVDKVCLLSFNKQDDLKAGVGEQVSIISYPRKNILKKGISFIKKKLHLRGAKDYEYLYRSFAKKLNKEETIFLNIGGDTYCYSAPYISYALNNVAKKNGIPNVFWGCSVEASTLENKKMIEDINKYAAVVVREKLSQDVFEKCLTDKSKIYKTCDPAFHLEITETDLPSNFKEKNTLGLNISPLVLKDQDNADDIMYQNAYCLIDYVLKNTDMSVCLIPHVYNVATNTQDIMILRKIYERYNDNKRVCIVDKELSCCELKYVISKCRFFIGARTHSTIAAYSSSVPCIALSYSVKSRGIAIDLFGTDDGYALPYKNITEANELKDAFVSVLYNNEMEILKRYEAVLPAYRQSIIEATKTIIKNL